MYFGDVGNVALKQSLPSDINYTPESHYHTTNKQLLQPRLVRQKQ